MPNSHYTDSNVPAQTGHIFITVDVQEMRCDTVYKICMVRDSFQWWAPKNIAMYLQIS